MPKAPKDTIRLANLKADYGPNWRLDLSSLDVEQLDLCTADGELADGMTLPTRRRVIINGAAPMWRQECATVHELAHVALDDHGMAWLTPQREEMIVTYLAPRLWGHLHRMGLRFPPRPEGCAELCRKAAKEAKRDEQLY